MLAVVITDAAEIGEFRFERRKFGAGAAELKQLEEWLREQGVQEVVMESTAQYWKPVWQSLEGLFRLHRAQAHSNKAPKGRKRDFTDAERLVRRHIAGELILSFVPDSEQRMWRMLTRTRKQLTSDRVRLQNQMEGYLEQIRIKLSSHVSDLLGLSARRMLQALAEGETDAGRIAELAVKGLRATQQELEDALRAAATLTALQCGILKLFLERLELLDRQINTVEKTSAEALHEHEDAVCRLAEVPGLGADSALQIICRGRPEGSHIPVGRADGVLGGLLSGQRRKRGGVGKRQVAQGQPAHEACSGAGGKCGSEGERKRVRSPLSASGRETRSLQSHLGCGAPDPPNRVEDPARTCEIRGTRSSHKPAGSPPACQQARSRPPTSRLSRTTHTCQCGGRRVTGLVFQWCRRASARRSAG